MGRIKGPLKIKGFKASQFMAEKIMEAKNLDKIKLPFTATGFKCSKKPKGVSFEGIEFAKEDKKPSKKNPSKIKKVVEKIKKKPKSKKKKK